MPRIVTRVEAGCLKIQSGGGGLMLFGLPFLAAGLFVLLGALDVVPIHRTGTMSTPVAILFGVAFALVGAGLVAGRSLATLDVTQQIVMKQWRLFVPVRTTTYQMGDYRAVTIRFVRGDSDSADQYPIGLKPAAGLDVVLARPGTYAEARELAATVARHLDFEIEDDSTDHPARLSASDAELPMAQRLRGVSPDTTPPRPPAMRSEITEQAGDVRISIQSPPLNPFMLISTGLPSIVAVVLLAWLLPPVWRRGPNPGEWIFFGFLLLGFWVLPSVATMMAVLRSRVGRTIVTASPAGLRIDARRLLVPGTRTIATIDAADILDVDFSTRDSIMAASRRAAEARVASMRDGSPATGDAAADKVFGVLRMFVKGGGVIVKTRAGVTKLGEGLADDEIRYLHAVTRRALVAR